MHLKKIIIVLFSIILLLSCNHHILKSGKIEFKNVLVEIPFEYRLGLPIIQVNINGNNYDFLFDTGAINVISSELAGELNLKSASHIIVRDSQGAKSVLKNTKLDSLKIGDARFYNIKAIVADLNKSTDISCLHIDGIIGSDLMKMAIWQIDFEKQIISITNNKELLQIDVNAQIIPFRSNSAGKQLVDIIINNITEKNITFDTGSNGGITCSKKTYTKLLKEDSQLNKNYGFGSNTSGIYGQEKLDSIFYIIPSTCKMGDLNINNQIIEFKEIGSRTIGTEFLKNYTVIIDWHCKEITLIEKNKVEINSDYSFGFKVSLESNKIYVKYIINNSSVAQQGLKLGDQIIEINSTDYREVSKDDYCTILSNGVFTNSDILSVKVLKDDKEIGFKFVKTRVLQLE